MPPSVNMTLSGFLSIDVGPRGTCLKGRLNLEAKPEDLDSLEG